MFVLTNRLGEKWGTKVILLKKRENFKKKISFLSILLEIFIFLHEVNFYSDKVRIV